MKVQVAPDIRSVDDFGDHIAVRGYQNYNAYADRLEPVGDGQQHAWANTNAKWSAVDSVLGDLDGVKTYADLGCNLGLYVMTAAINHGLTATGYDYDKTYIQVCNTVKDKFSLPCDFTTKPFSEVDETYDCVSALGLIHHLYHHTESYGNLGSIMQQLAGLTNRYLILEFPNEHDPKAMKWVNLEGRIKNGEYSEAELLRVARQHFGTITVTGRVHPDRPIFLMDKGPASC